jgi:hypothetical protein
MWSFLIRGGVAVVVLATVWLFTAQWCSLLIDRVSTVLQFGSQRGGYGRGRKEGGAAPSFRLARKS